jgi:putative FmdB family regulatory protein
LPTYEYACQKCGNQFDVVHGFRDDPPTTCEACGGELQKVFHPVGIVFKGSGFYKTDSRKKEKTSSTASSSSSSSSENSTSESSASSQKSEGSKSEGSESKESSSSDSAGTSSGSGKSEKSA